jgi:hypothetical protein
MATPSVLQRAKQLESKVEASVRLPPKKVTKAKAEAPTNPAPVEPDDGDADDEEGDGEEASGKRKGGRRSINDSFENAVRGMPNGGARSIGRRVAKAQRLMAKALEAFTETFAAAGTPEVEAAAEALKGEAAAEALKVEAAAEALNNGIDALAESVAGLGGIPRGIGVAAVVRYTPEVGHEVVVKPNAVETYAQFGAKDGEIYTVVRHIAGPMFAIKGKAGELMVLSQHLALA